MLSWHSNKSSKFSVGHHWLHYMREHFLGHWVPESFGPWIQDASVIGHGSWRTTLTDVAHDRCDGVFHWANMARILERGIPVLSSYTIPYFPDLTLLMCFQHITSFWHLLGMRPAWTPSKYLFRMRNVNCIRWLPSLLETKWKLPGQSAILRHEVWVRASFHQTWAIIS